jgi:TetR/AcrR family transcriptional regulator, tetracycline repressor protein
MDGAHIARGQRRGAPPAGQRLTREVIVATAAGIISRDGAQGFSLRALAGELQVAPNALYNHIRNKEDLIDAVVDDFVADLEFPDGDQPWAKWTRDVAVSFRSQLLAHPGRTSLLLARAGSTPDGPTALVGFLDRLEAAGVERAVAHLIWHTLLVVIVGSIQQDMARDRVRDGTFEAVLDIAMTGIRSIAAEPAATAANELLIAHKLA